MTDAAMLARLERLLDRTEIFDLVRFERLCRDQRDFPGMIGCYVPHAPVRTSWFDGTVEDFAEASRQKMASGASQAKHWIMPARLEFKDDRALVESPAVIFDRMTFDGIAFDMFQYCRFFSRVLKTAKGWKLGSFEGIYQRDRLETVDPRDQLPVDWTIIVPRGRLLLHRSRPRADRDRALSQFAAERPEHRQPAVGARSAAGEKAPGR